MSAEELFEIYKLRVSVFVVEQNCPYQEVDDADRSAYHLWLKDEDGIEACARVLPPFLRFFIVYDNMNNKESADRKLKEERL